MPVHKTRTSGGPSGTSSRRRQRHGEITAVTPTDNICSDSLPVEPLLEETFSGVLEEETLGPGASETALDRGRADGACDTFGVYETIEHHGTSPVIPLQKNAKTARGGNSGGTRLFLVTR